MFTDDIVICESREHVNKMLERWFKYALERRRMNESHNMTEYMCVNERDSSETLKLKGAEIEKVEDIKYLGLTIQSNGDWVEEVKKFDWVEKSVRCDKSSVLMK